jgi:hypothetical protein
LKKKFNEERNIAKKIITFVGNKSGSCRGPGFSCRNLPALNTGIPLFNFYSCLFKKKKMAMFLSSLNFFFKKKPKENFYYTAKYILGYIYRSKREMQRSKMLVSQINGSLRQSLGGRVAGGVGRFDQFC